jgi:hypothetical protein
MILRLSPPANKRLHLTSSALTAVPRTIFWVVRVADGVSICGKARSSIEERCSQVSCKR